MVTGLALLLAAYAVLITARLIDARRERDEAINKYDAAYLIGYATGQDDQRRAYQNSKPWQDGYTACMMEYAAAISEASGPQVEC